MTIENGKNVLSNIKCSFEWSSQMGSAGRCRNCGGGVVGQQIAPCNAMRSWIRSASSMREGRRERAGKARRLSGVVLAGYSVCLGALCAEKYFDILLIWMCVQGLNRTSNCRVGDWMI